MKKEIKELVDLYKIFSPSFQEQELSEYVQKKLKAAGVKFELMDDQIFSIKEGKPLLSAHMDQVSVQAITKVKMKKGKIKADGNLGADDKNGVWILLQLIRKYPDEVSFIFSTGEETVTQNDISDWLTVYGEELEKKVPYGLVFDRRGKGDIIGEMNEYCTEEFSNDVEACIGDLGYSGTMGVFSDADALSEHLSCVNLSCGYYKAHSEKEYTKVKELYNALAAGEKIINEMTQYYQKPIKYGGSWWRKSSAERGPAQDWLWDEDDRYHVWYCPICETIYLEDYMEDLDIDDDYTCADGCASKLMYYGECFDYELERLFDGDIPLTPENTRTYEETMFCPICGWYSYSNDEICADCGTTLLPTTPDGYTEPVDYHDEMLKEM